MKKNIILAAALLVVCGNMNAQTSEYYNTKHEIGVTIGGGANSEILSGLADMSEDLGELVITNFLSGGTHSGYVEYGDESYIPTISAEYYYHVNKVIGLGGIVAFNGMTRDMYGVWHDNTKDVEKSRKYIGKAKRTNISVLPAMKIDWLRRKHIGLYSKVALGVTFMYESQKADDGDDFTDTDPVFNFHASLIGFEGGSEHFRGFVELGMGEQGIGLAGLRYKF